MGRRHLGTCLRSRWSGVHSERFLRAARGASGKGCSEVSMNLSWHKGGSSREGLRTMCVCCDGEVAVRKTGR
jgi:hypothetical protein